MNKLKKEKGITLVALIITIVVLLILAGVAIGTVKNSDIIGYSKNATSDYTIAQEKEQIGLAVSEWKIQKMISGSTSVFKDVIKNALQGQADSVEGDPMGPLTVTFNKTGNQYRVTDDGELEIIPEGITLSVTELSIAPGGTTTITAKLTGGLTGEINWETSNTEIAAITISQDGLIATVSVPEGVEIGLEAIITATCKEYTATCTVSTGIKVSDVSYFLFEGTTVKRIKLRRCRVFGVTYI